METTIIRPGQVTELKRVRTKDTGKVVRHGVISFSGGYVKFAFTEKDIPDGLMLEDKAEVTISFKDSEE